MMKSFPHSVRSRNELKMVKIQNRLGHEGRSVYWDLVEMLYEHPGHSLSVCEIERYADELRTKPYFIEVLIYNLGVFRVSECGELFTCDTVINNTCAYEAAEKLKADRKKLAKERRIKLVGKYKNKRLYNTNIKLWYEIINTVYRRDNYTCAYCGGVGGKLECDHITPISKGGTNELENLTTSCQKCNRQKRDKTVSEFLQWRIKKGIV